MCWRSTAGGACRRLFHRPAKYVCRFPIVSSRALALRPSVGRLRPCGVVNVNRPKRPGQANRGRNGSRTRCARHGSTRPSVTRSSSTCTMRRCTPRTAGRGARLAVRGNPQRGRPVRSRHQPGRDAAPVDRFHRPCGHGPRQANVPVPAGHPLWPQGAGRIRQHPRDRRVGDGNSMTTNQQNKLKNRTFPHFLAPEQITSALGNKKNNKT